MGKVIVLTPCILIISVVVVVVVVVVVLTGNVDAL